MSRKLGGSKLTKPYNRQWLTKNPVELGVWGATEQRKQLSVVTDGSEGVL
jgi:hypothetical protein